jgi:two-component system, NarL family, invasion response regulator UvrY
MNVLIADDHGIVRRGLKDILADEFPRLCVTEVSNAQEALVVSRKQTWDLVLLDIKMPGRNGLEVLDELKKLQPKTPVVIISAFPEGEYAIRAFKLGAAAYVAKEGASDELLAAVRKVLSGGRYVTAALAEKLAATLSGETPTNPHETLSNRELEVLRLVATGKTIKEIGAELHLSEKTVGTYRLRLSKKLNLSTNVELARYAIQHQLAD